MCRLALVLLLLALVVAFNRVDAQFTDQGALCSQWNEQFLASAPPFFNGPMTNTPQCQPGTVSATFISDLIRIMSLYREIAGLDTITPLTVSQSTQQSVQRCVHLAWASQIPFPTAWNTSTPCYSTQAVAGCEGASLAAFPSYATAKQVLSLWMSDFGAPSDVHNRRYLLNWMATSFGAGFAGAGPSYVGLNVGSSSTSLPPLTDRFYWPPDGLVPIQALRDSIGRIGNWHVALTPDALTEYSVLSCSVVNSRGDSVLASGTNCIASILPFKSWPVVVLKLAQALIVPDTYTITITVTNGPDVTGVNYDTRVIDCTPPPGSCGDGVQDAGEQCDQGPLNGQPISCCTDDCKMMGNSVVCRPSQHNICDPPETCRSGVCPTDTVKNGVLCASAQSSNLCSSASYCAAGLCPPAFLPDGAQCRPSSGACDPPESCTGGICPPDMLSPSTQVCRPPVSNDVVCDPPEFCTGGSAACPADVVAGSNVTCRASNPCLGAGRCKEGSCDAKPIICGDGVVTEPYEQCDEGANNGSPGSCCTAICQYRAAGELCRPMLRPCDKPESCSGSDGSCPTNKFQEQGVVCRAASTACDLDDVCTGTTDTCPTNVFKQQGELCQAAPSECYLNAVCPGNGLICPDNVPVSTGSPCSSGSACYADEQCINGECSGRFVCACSQDTDCDDRNPCTVDICEMPAMTCSYTPAVDGEACAMADPCVNDAICIASVCTAGSSISGCPQQCSKRGICCLSLCQCDFGYSGPDCSLGPASVGVPTPSSPTVRIERVAAAGSPLSFAMNVTQKKLLPLTVNVRVTPPSKSACGAEMMFYAAVARVPQASDFDQSSVQDNSTLSESLALQITSLGTYYFTVDPGMLAACTFDMILSTSPTPPGPRSKAGRIAGATVGAITGSLLAGCCILICILSAFGLWFGWRSLVWRQRRKRRFFAIDSPDSEVPLVFPADDNEPAVEAVVEAIPTHLAERKLGAVPRLASPPPKLAVPPPLLRPPPAATGSSQPMTTVYGATAASTTAEADPTTDAAVTASPSARSSSALTKEDGGKPRQSRFGLAALTSLLWDASEPHPERTPPRARMADVVASSTPPVPTVSAVTPSGTTNDTTSEASSLLGSSIIAGASSGVPATTSSTPPAAGLVLGAAPTTNSAPLPPSTSASPPKADEVTPMAIPATGEIDLTASASTTPAASATTPKKGTRPTTISRAASSTSLVSNSSSPQRENSALSSAGTANSNASATSGGSISGGGGVSGSGVRQSGFFDSMLGALSEATKGIERSMRTLGKTGPPEDAAEELEFQKTFFFPATEHLLSEYTVAALTRDTLFRGRLCFASNHVCFYAPPRGGQEGVMVCIPWKRVSRIRRGEVARLDLFAAGDPRARTLYLYTSDGKAHQFCEVDNFSQAWHLLQFIWSTFHRRPAPPAATSAPTTPAATLPTLPTSSVAATSSNLSSPSSGASTILTPTTTAVSVPGVAPVLSAVTPAPIL